MANPKKVVKTKTIIICTGEVIVLSKTEPDELTIQEFNEALQSLGEAKATILAFDSAPIKANVAPRVASFKFADSLEFHTQTEKSPEADVKLTINEDK
jgi:hypothetical protein